jgi:zinc protease
MLWEEDLEKKTSALSPDQIGAALKRHIDPANLVLVSAGDFATNQTTKSPAAQ